MCQKRQISLPMGYKTATPKTGDWEQLWCHFRTSSFAKKQTSQSFFYCELINLLRNGTTVRCLWENKKKSEKSVFREAWSPEMTLQSFPVPRFGLAVLYPTGSEIWCIWYIKARERKIAMEKNFFAVFIITLGRFDRANKKSLSHTL